MHACMDRGEQDAVEWRESAHPCCRQQQKLAWPSCSASGRQQRSIVRRAPSRDGAGTLPHSAAREWSSASYRADEAERAWCRCHDAMMPHRHCVNGHARRCRCMRLSSLFPHAARQQQQQQQLRALMLLRQRTPRSDAPARYTGLRSANEHTKAVQVSTGLESPGPSCSAAQVMMGDAHTMGWCCYGSAVESRLKRPKMHWPGSG